MLDASRVNGAKCGVVSSGAKCGLVSRVAWSPRLSTNVSGEMCPTVPHPLDMVGVRLRSFRSASFRNGPGGSWSSCVGGGV